MSLFALAGCGNQYRPVVTAVNPTGPAGQPTKYAAVISGTGPTASGLLSLVDFSGDTVVNTTTLGMNPVYFNLNLNGSEAYVINGDGTLNSFTLTTSLIPSDITSTTLPPGANPISFYAANTDIYVVEQKLNQIGVLTLASPGSPTDPAFLESLVSGNVSGLTGSNTVFTVGPLLGSQSTTTTGASTGLQRVYTLVQNGAGAAGFAAAIETSTNTISAALPVGVNPIYGVMTADDRRAFVLNNGSASVTVINAQTNALDSFNNPASPTTATSTIPVGTAPVWADFAPPLSELLVLNQGNGTTAGSVSVISIPLCTTNAISNPNCDSSNPIDAVGFGSVVATIPVGINPVMIACLQDGTQCYVANQGNGPAGIAGSVSVINLATDTVIATIPAAYQNTNPNDSLVHGYPTYIAATTGMPTGKVYVISGAEPTGTAGASTLTYASTDMTVISTDTNTVSLHLPLQGYGISVRVNAP